MSKYRRAAKIDNNQNQIVKDLEKLGYSVSPGHDDILVGYKGHTFWYEIKALDAISNITNLPRPSEIKPSQVKLLADFKGHYKIVWTTQQIIDDIKLRLNKG